VNDAHLNAIERNAHDRRVISDMLETSRWFSEAALRARSWCAVPIFEGIGVAAARGMAAATVPGTLAKAFTSENGMVEEQYQFVVSDVAFLEFERLLLLRHFLVISVPEQFSIVHEANYYWTVAASPEFIDATFGMPPLQVIETFERECESVTASKEREYMLAIAVRCRRTCDSLTAAS
jgi:hypothetical protein